MTHSPQIPNNKINSNLNQKQKRYKNTKNKHKRHSYSLCRVQKLKVCRVPSRPGLALTHIFFSIFAGKYNSLIFEIILSSQKVFHSTHSKSKHKNEQLDGLAHFLPQRKLQPRRTSTRKGSRTQFEISSTAHLIQFCSFRKLQWFQIFSG